MRRGSPGFRTGLVIGLIAGHAANIPAQELSTPPLVQVEQVRLANGLYARGLYALALEEYDRLVALDLPPAEAATLWYRAGECARLLGEPEKAIRYFLRVVALEPEASVLNRARFRLADLTFQEAKFANTLRQLDALLANAPAPDLAAPAAYLRAQVLIKLEKPAEAEQAYRWIVERFPEDPVAAYAALELAGTVTEATERKRYLEQVRKLAPSPDMEVEAMWGLALLAREERKTADAAEKFWELWMQHPDSARVRRGRLQMAWAQLQADQFERALVLAKATPAEERAGQEDTWLYLEGIVYSRNRKPEEAVPVFEALLEGYATSRFRSQAAFELAAQYARLGRHADVLSLQEEMGLLGERDLDAAWLIAESARAGEQWKLAVAQYTKVVTLAVAEDPRKVDAAYLLAWVRDRGGLEDAANAYRGFANRFPQDARAVQALHRAGTLLLEEGNTAGALDCWSRAVELDPEHPRTTELWFRMAMIDLRADRPDSALQLLDQVLDRDPEQAEALYWSGVVLDREGKGAEAAARLEQALAAGLHGPEGQQARLRLGVNYRSREKDVEAVSALQPLLADAPEALSDGWLLWLYRRSEADGAEVPISGLADAMTQENRAPGVQELGWYAHADEAMAGGNMDKAITAWRRGLALTSGSEETVEAWLALGRALQQQDQLDSAAEALEAASRLASSLEQGRLQVAAMMALGDVKSQAGDPAAAARLYMGVAVLYEDPVQTPEALRKAAAAFDQAGESKRAEEARRELARRTETTSTL